MASVAIARILVVDDDEAVREMASSVLGARGHVVETAPDGEEGLRKALAQPPSLIVTDVRMPGMDGWALARRLRADPRTALVPVVFLTALNTSEDRLLGFRLGADDYLPKPMTPEELCLRVEKSLKDAERVQKFTRLIASLDGAAGSLELISVPTLLMALEMEQQSGTLVVKSKRGTAHLALRKGRVIRASMKDRASPHGVECVYAVLDWSHGRYAFMPEAVVGDDEIGRTVQHLLLERARRLDER